MWAPNMPRLSEGRAMPPVPFTVPFGLDPSGSVVPPDAADHAAMYSCPSCRSPLILKAGSVRRHHFAHKPDADCSPESALHEAAKLRIAASVAAWRSGSGPRAVVRRRCRQCRSDVDRPVTERATEASVEHRLPSGRVLDVAVLDAAGGVLMGVEVLVTHEVDADKEASLGDLTWVEVRASAEADPAVWGAERAGGRLPSGLCADCLDRPVQRRRETLALAARYGLDEPAEGYLAIEHECWQCHRPMPLFFWPGVGNGDPAPEPKPRTVRLRYSKTVDASYDGNGCIHCDALQGQWFLEENLFNVVGDAPDAIELQDRFFPPPSGDEPEWAERGLTLSQMVDIVVPPERRLRR